MSEPAPGAGEQRPRGTGELEETPDSRRWRRRAALAALVAIAASALAIWTVVDARRPARPAAEAAATAAPAAAPEPPEPLPDRRVLAPASFNDLPGWADERHGEAVPALLRSCDAILKREAASAFLPPPEAPTPPATKAAPPAPAPIAEGADAAVTIGAWQELCRGAARLERTDHAAVRAFFERESRPYRVANRDDPVGLFTGYYEPLLHGSRRRSERFHVPLYLRPPDLISVDLGRFRPELLGKKIAGRLEGKELVPFPDRAAIDAGALRRRRLELVWVDDPLDSFFLQVQGSGRIQLAEGGTMRVGYAGQNGHPYFAIGRELIDRGALTREEVSLQSIRAWLEAHPDEAPAVLARNPSYVFFRRLEGAGPLGSQGVVLTPGRSLAVDRDFLPLGALLWLDATAPGTAPGQPDRPLRRLLVAQDTGGAIRGPVRGDVFWGHSEEAEHVAGHMKHQGRIWMLLPKRPASVPATS